MPRLKTKQELEIICKQKDKVAWKGGSNKNDFFNVAPIMKPKVLDPWTMGRVQMPERGYNKFFFSKCKLTCRGLTAFFIRKSSYWRVRCLESWWSNGQASSPILQGAAAQTHNLGRVAIKIYEAISGASSSLSTRTAVPRWKSGGWCVQRRSSYSMGIILENNAKSSIQNHNGWRNVS